MKNYKPGDKVTIGAGTGGTVVATGYVWGLEGDGRHHSTHELLVVQQDIDGTIVFWHPSRARIAS